MNRATKSEEQLPSPFHGHHRLQLKVLPQETRQQLPDVVQSSEVKCKAATLLDDLLRERGPVMEHHIR